jgi:hypothetical protein
MLLSGLDGINLIQHNVSNYRSIEYFTTVSIGTGKQKQEFNFGFEMNNFV